MLVALVAVMLLGGASASDIERFVQDLDKLVGKELADPAARAEARAAVGEMKATVGDYHHQLKDLPREIAAKNADEAVRDVEFEQTIVALDGARTAAFERLVASREKLRRVIPADRWDATVGAASRK
jgi:hypothetical protein